MPVNLVDVRSLGELEKAVSRSEDALLLNIRRGDAALFIVLR